MNESRSTPEFDDILAECLDALLRGRQTIADCLERYPDQASDLKPALQIALLTSRLKSPELSGDRVDALEANLRSRMVARPPRKMIQLPVIPVAISRVAAAVAIVLLLAFGSGAGLVTASASSLPGDPLYGIKRLWEAIVLVIMSLTDQLDDFSLHLAEVRLDEVKELDGDGRLNQSALVDLYSATAKAVSYADTAPEQTAVIQYLDEAKNTLQTVHPSSEAMPVYQDMLTLMTLVRRPDGSLQAPSSDTPPSLNAPVVTPTNTPTPTPTATVTLTPTLTATPTDSDTPSPTATDTSTATPRIPPTPTRTPSPSPTMTLTPTETPTPTASWTPLPIPTVPTVVFPTRIVPQPDGSERTPSGSSEPQDTPPVRQTQQSVYMTQTAGPPAATSTSTP